MEKETGMAGGDDGALAYAGSNCVKSVLDPCRYNLVKENKWPICLISSHPRHGSSSARTALACPALESGNRDWQVRGYGLATYSYAT